MNAAVRYFSKSGNTKKIAEAIADAVGTQAKPLPNPIGEEVDLLFLGGAIYGFGIDENLKDYISTLPGTIPCVAIFSTTAVVPSAYPHISTLLEEQGLTVCKEEFHCWGKFLLMHKGRPDDNDLEHAAAFARRVAHGRP